MSENQNQRELTSEEIRKLFLIVQNELINIKKKHEEDINKLEDNIKSLKEELTQKNQEIKTLKNIVEKISHNKPFERSKTAHLIKEKDVKTIIKYTEEEIDYMNTFNKKYLVKINGNEKILDLSNDSNNNTINKPNQKLGNEELLYFSKFKFGRLQQLYLGKNNISDISVLASMKLDNLQKLSLANNAIIDISCLENYNFPELKELYLYNNYISDISVLVKVKFKNLEKLSLFSNEIRDINILEQTDFPKLKVIRLDNNKIIDISVFSRVKYDCLEKLSLFNNKISDLNGIDNLNIPALKEIWLNGNNIDMAITSNEKIYDKIREKNIKIIV